MRTTAVCDRHRDAGRPAQEVVEVEGLLDVVLRAVGVPGVLGEAPAAVDGGHHDDRQPGEELVDNSSIAPQKIAMTAPVTQSASGAGRWRVSFMMPSAYSLETLPVPNDRRVQFELLPGEKRAVVRFDSFSTDSNLGRHRAQLEAWVLKQGLKPVGDYVSAFYNDPFTLPWNRRNEWWVPVE